jgi:selT/selW/selH-like putative selenoprotein|tara:strand:- start:8927 stop:9040 length:114 start_codon:yes stop_codon:yes gene_type:complete
LTEGITGSFEVTIDDELVFSKLKEGRFPTEEEINGWK